MVAGFKSILIKFGIFFVIAVALLALLYNTMINNVPGGTRGYTADFTSVSGLGVGDDIRVAGVRVGKVTGIKIIDGDHAQVKFEVQKDQPFLDNTSLVMRYQNLLGQRYLSMVQPARRGQPQSPNSVIPISRTNPGFDLTELLDGFRPLFQVLRPADVNKLATTLIQVLQGEGGTVEQLLQQTTQLTNFVADRDQVFGQVLDRLTPVLNDLAGQGGQLRSTVHELKLLMTGLAKDRKGIGTSISRLSRLITSTSSFLKQAREPATVDVHLFRKVAETLGSQRSLLTQSLNAFGDVFGDLGRASSYRNSVNVYLCTMWIKINAVEINLSGKKSGGPWTEVCQ